MRESNKQTRVIAIDGPAGAGKSTTARFLASRLGFTYLDSGAFYRAVTLQALESGVPLQDENKLTELAKNIDLRFETTADKNRIFIGSREVTDAIRTPEIDKAVTPVAALPEIRKVIVQRLQEMGRDKNVIIEGRDAATVIFPDADLKIYLDASIEERAKRRLQDYQSSGKTAKFEELKAEIARRDEADKSRAEGALQIAPRAVIVDTTGLTVEEQVEKILKLYYAKFPADRSSAPPLSVKRAPMHGFYWFIWTLVRNLSRLLWRRTAVNVDNIPHAGPVIIACNHISYYDPPLVSVSIPRPVHFMAKKELFSVFLLGFIIRHLNAFPVNRQGFDRVALEKGVDILQKGDALLVFPEGTRSRKKGEFLPPKPGVGMLARQAGVPIIPAYISGSNELSKVFFKFGRVRVSFGPPIPKDWVISQPDDKDGYRKIANEVMKRIGEIKKLASS